MFCSFKIKSLIFKLSVVFSYAVLLFYCFLNVTLAGAGIRGWHGGTITKYRDINFEMENTSVFMRSSYYPTRSRMGNSWNKFPT